MFKILTLRQFYLKSVEETPVKPSGRAVSLFKLINSVRNCIFTKKM